jgi:hypothetical protein
LDCLLEELPTIDVLAYLWETGLFGLAFRTVWLLRSLMLALPSLYLAMRMSKVAFGHCYNLLLLFFCHCLKILKFSNRYAANRKRAVNVGTGKLNGLKSHDYHIFIERLMLVMFRGYFKGNLWKMFVEISYFYR